MDTTTRILGVAGLTTTLSGTLGAQWLGVKSQAQLMRRTDLRDLLDAAAVSLADSDALTRDALRELLDVAFYSDFELDEVLTDPGSGLAFPSSAAAAAAAVERLARQHAEVRGMADRLAMRVGVGEPPTQSFIQARDRLGSVATTMRFAVEGTVGPGDDLPELIERFFAAVDARKHFLDEASGILG
jgi:hypothetical protein